MKRRLNTLLPRAADAASFPIIHTDISGAPKARNIVVAALIRAYSAKYWKL